MNTPWTRRQLTTLPAALAVLALGACGSDGGSDGTPVTSDVAVRFSDAPVEALKSVVVTVDRITFRRGGGSSDEATDEIGSGTAGNDGTGEAETAGEPSADATDIVVERFTSEELGIVDAETFTIDLLDVQGNDSRLVLDSVELPVGRYSDLRLDIVDEDLNFSYVEEEHGSELKTLKVPSGELKLGAFDVTPLSTQTLVIEFGLRQSMTYNPGPDRYILKPRGVRIVQLEEAAAIEGSVDVEALHARAPCDAKTDATSGNVVYLYAGHGLDAAALADDFDATLAGAAGDGRIAPIASTVPAEDGRFVLSFLEPGDYTLAASCDAANDDADALDAALTVPAPADQLVETTLARGERRSCTLGGATPLCGTATTGTP